MPEPKFQLGDRLYVCQPHRRVECCMSIIGPVVAVTRGDDASIRYMLDAQIRLLGGEDRLRLEFAEDEVKLQPGSSRPFERPTQPNPWDEIGRLWNV